MLRYIKGRFLPKLSTSQATSQPFQAPEEHKSLGQEVFLRLFDSEDTKASRAHTVRHKIFVLRQLTLPELAARILDFAEEWANDCSLLYLGPENGFYEVTGPEARYGEQILTYGPLSRLQAKNLRAVRFSIACTRRHPDPPRQLPGSPVATFAAYGSHEAQQYDTYLAMLRTVDQGDFNTMAKFYRICGQTFTMPYVGLCKAEWRWDSADEDVRVRMRGFEEGGYVHLTASCWGAGQLGANCIRYAKIEVQYAAWQ